MLNRDLYLPPRFFGPRLQTQLIEKLHEEVEGTCSGRYGFIITVTNVRKIGMGEVQEGGYVLFPIEFEAIVFKPFKGEVLDAVVTAVNKVCSVVP